MIEIKRIGAFCVFALSCSFSVAGASDLRDALYGPAGSWFSSSMVFLGDWNGDGHDELAIGAPNFPGGGMVRIVSGADLSILWEGTRPSPGGGGFGRSLAEANDVNKDGYRDLLVGSRGAGGSSKGWAFVFSGEWIVKTAANQTPQSNLLLHSIESPVGGDFFGETVLGGLNMDNDGYSDFLVGGTGPNSGDFLHAGIVRAYSGIDGSLIWELSGDHSYGGLGSSLATIRPNNVYDTDGMQDYLVGADGSGQVPGEVWVLSAPDGQVHAKLGPPPGTTTGEMFGHSIAVVGDTDGDGKDDFVVGAPYYLPDNKPGTTFGLLALFLSGSPDCSVYGVVGGPHVGLQVAATGDVNGDGIGDFSAAGNLSATPTVYSGRDCTLLDTLFPPSGTASNVAGAGDLDNDGLNDVVTGSTSGSVAYVYDTADLVVPAFVDSAWLLGGAGAPRAYVTVRYPTYGLQGQSVVIDVEHDVGAGFFPGSTNVVPVPPDAPPQLEHVTFLGPTVVFVLGGTYRYRTRSYLQGEAPGPWSEVVEGHPSADRALPLNWYVNIVDQGMFFVSMSSVCGDPYYFALNDYDQDCDVDIVDFGYWVSWRTAINM